MRSKVPIYTAASIGAVFSDCEEALDLVTTNLVSSFREQQGFPEDLDVPSLFEHFANFCVASTEYSDEFDVEDIHVAGGNDLQLDGVMIIVNGVLHSLQTRLTI